MPGQLTCSPYLFLEIRAMPATLKNSFPCFALCSQIFFLRKNKQPRCFPGIASQWWSMYFAWRCSHVQLPPSPNSNKKDTFCLKLWIVTVSKNKAAFHVFILPKFWVTVLIISDHWLGWWELCSKAFVGHNYVQGKYRQYKVGCYGYSMQLSIMHFRYKPTNSFRIYSYI